MANKWLEEAEQALQQVSDHQYNAIRLFIKVDTEDAPEQLLWAGASDETEAGGSESAELGDDTRRS